MIEKDDVLPSDLIADENLIGVSIEGAESHIPDVDELTDAIQLIAAWDHTDNSSHRVVGDPEAALRIIDETLALLSEFGHAPEDLGKVNQLTSFLKTTQKGFKYRQERGMPSVLRQRNEVRKKIAEGDFNTAGQMLETMADQPDTSDLVSALRNEYMQVMEIMEELSDEDGTFELDIGKLWTKVFKHNQGLDFETSISSNLLTRYKQVAVLNKNLKVILPWAEMQGSEQRIEAMEESLPEIEGAILDRVVSIITQVTSSIWMDKVTVSDFSQPSKYDELDLRSRIEAVVADLRLEFQQAGVSMDASEIDNKLREINLKIKQAHLVDNQPARKKLHQISMVVRKAMRQDVDERSIQDLNQRRLQILALQNFLPAAIRVTEEAKIFLDQI